MTRGRSATNIMRLFRQENDAKGNRAMAAEKAIRTKVVITPQ